MPSRDCEPSSGDSVPNNGDILPDSRDLPKVKDVCASSDFLISEVYEPFISEGSISLLNDEANGKKIKILRDTGAS